MFKSEWRMGWMNPNIKPHSMDSWVPDREQTLHDLLLAAGTRDTVSAIAHLPAMLV